MFRASVADLAGHLNGGGLLARALALRRLLRRTVLENDEKFVGLLLPPSVGAVVANVAVSLDRRVAVNLNYTLSREVLNAGVVQCGIRHVLTSRRMVQRGNLDFDAETVFLEDVVEAVTVADRIASACQAWLLPAAVLEHRLHLNRIDPDDLLTVVFTSGSTGQPKGVMLTHRNVGANIEAFATALDLRSNDVLVGVLPFFHALGYTATLWAPLILEKMVVYHYNPLERTGWVNLSVATRPPSSWRRQLCSGSHETLPEGRLCQPAIGVCGRGTIIPCGRNGVSEQVRD